ncbi:hypothetical protein QQ045_017692 [Rhodiola kirilowii]
MRQISGINSTANTTLSRKHTPKISPSSKSAPSRSAHWSDFARIGRIAMMLTSGDASGFKVLFSIVLMYGIISVLVYSVVHMKFITPLGLDAPLDRFSEARAVEHVRVLTMDIDGRQEGRHGLREAAAYIRKELHLFKDRAKSNIRIEIEDNVVGGSFNMMFLGRGISLAYRNHTNIVMRISSVDALETDASVLLNGHYDGPIGSPGAADCGSCVASMMEIARLIVDSGYVPPRPIIFLFNGAEELFLLGSHGFVKTHKWYESIGAFINVEASGTGGPDLVCQSGPGAWPSLIYAQSAIYPMAHSAAQDVFPVIPGDTDYRIFAEDGSDIPGLDIIFLLGGYFYHTSFDTLERLVPGSIQARGENLFSVLKTFSSSSNLRTAQQRTSAKALTGASDDERAVFFDYLSLFMILYSKKVAVVLHCTPVFIFFVMPFVLRLPSKGFCSAIATLINFIKDMLLHAIGIILGAVIPVLFSVLRLLFSSHAMNWFHRPCLAFMMFIPSSLIGILIPQFFRKSIPLSHVVTAQKTSNEKLAEEARFWGSFGYYAMFTMAYVLAGLSGGFLTLFMAASMLLAWICLRVSAKVPRLVSVSWAVYYVVPLIPCLVYCAYFGGLLVQFLIEKMGMMGSLPAPYGFFIPDIIVAAIIGIVTGLCMGPLIPVCGHWLARKSILKFLLHLTVLSLALSSQFFPYSSEAPKRVVFQHTLVTSGVGDIMDSSYDFSVVDSNSLHFVFKHSPEVANELNIVPDLSLNTVKLSEPKNWLALFPVSFLFSNSLKFSSSSEEIIKEYQHLPSLSTYKPQTLLADGSRRVHLQLDLGSVKEVWVTVLNITGPLSSWSFAENMLPAPETMNNGPPSYILRLSGISSEKWTFWLEANSLDALRIEVAVLDQYLVDGAKKLKSLFPSWVDVTAYSSLISAYTF